MSRFRRGAAERLRRLPILRGNDHFARLVRNGLSLFTGNSVVIGLQFAQVLVLTRALLPEGYGTYILVMTYVLLVNQFFDVRATEMTVKFGSEYLALNDHQRLSAVIKLSYGINFLTGLFAFFLVMISAPWAAQTILHNSALAPLISLYALTLLISTGDSTSSAILRVTDRFKWMSLYAGGMAVLEFGAIVLAIGMGAGLRGILLALIAKDLISSVVNISLALVAIRQHIPGRALWQAPVSSLHSRYRELASFLFHTNVMAYVRMINTKIDVLILGFFRPPEEVGIYKLARQVAGLTAQIIDPLYTAVLPDLARLWAQKRFGEYRHLLYQISLTMSLLLGSVGAGLIVFQEPIIRLIAGEAYLAAAVPLIICSWGFIIGGIFLWAWPAALSLQHPEYGTAVGLLGVVGQITLALLLVPTYGSVGNAVSLLATSIAPPLLAWLVLRKLGQVEHQLAGEVLPAQLSQ